MSPHALRRVLRGKRPVTPALAVSLEEIGWSDAETWMRLQAMWDLARERAFRADIRRTCPDWKPS